MYVSRISIGCRTAATSAVCGPLQGTGQSITKKFPTTSQGSRSGRATSASPTPARGRARIVCLLDQQTRDHGRVPEGPLALWRSTKSSTGSRLQLAAVIKRRLVAGGVGSPASCLTLGPLPSGSWQRLAALVATLYTAYILCARLI